MKLSWWTILLTTAASCEVTVAQSLESGPVIDMHMHGPLAENWGPPIEEWLDKAEHLNIEKVALAAYADQLAEWIPKSPEKLVPSLMFPCIAQADDACNPEKDDWPDIEWVRSEIQAGRIRMFGEVITELYGIFPNDKRLEPYFSLAEEFDIPFGLHMGPGPAWAARTESVYKRFPDFQISAGNPLELEVILRRHPDLRLFVMHAGWPMVDEMLAILWHNPNVYIELGHLQSAISRAEYNHYLKRIVDAGYGDRVMYGSDVGFDEYGEGISAILEAGYLTDSQKRDILYNNAARFLRLTDEQIAVHHSQ
jgi:hypothetical protein